MKHIMVVAFLALGLLGGGSLGCTNAATEACKSASVVSAERGAPPGSLSACGSCCSRQGSFAEANLSTAEENACRCGD